MRVELRSSSRSTASRVRSATAVKPPAMRSTSAAVSPGFNSKIAGLLTLPTMATWVPMAPTWITSPACTTTSPARSPFSNRS
jgi:hypothetical protein